MENSAHLLLRIAATLSLALPITTAWSQTPPPPPAAQPPAPQPATPQPPAVTLPPPPTAAVPPPTAAVPPAAAAVPRPAALPAAGGGASGRATGRPQAALQTVVNVISGSPYGVARIEIPLAEPAVGERLPVLEVTSDDGRVLYPVTRDLLAARPPRPQLTEDDLPRLIGGGRLLRRVSEMVRDFNAPNQQVVVAREALFLFHGDQPLTVRLSVPDVAGRTELTLTPSPAASGEIHRDLLMQWWQGFTAALSRQSGQADYPTVVESYLIALLSGRLDLPLPEGFLDDEAADQTPLVASLSLIAGTEAAHATVLRQTAAGVRGGGEVANLPLPAAPQWQPVSVEPMAEAAALAEVPIEPTASRVPPECFYLRFGSFANYLWFRDLSEEYGGDLGRMITLRGVANDSAQRLESQLGLRTTELARLMGDSIVLDQSLIGSDLFLTDGASLGVLFHVRSTFLFGRSLDGERQALLRTNPDASQRTVTIGGHDVSLIETADHRIRSFLASDGDFVFVSNSERLVERFFEVGRSGQSLATTPHFRLARQLAPIDQGHTVFAYFSPEMLQGLLAPEYLIETRRRQQAAAEMALLRLARLASANEGLPLWEIEDLVDAGFLPLGFGDRADGSGLIAVGDDLVDSLRGRRGSFLPIADVRISAVTLEEDQWYRQIAAYYNSQWPEMDPLMVALRRQTVADDDPAAINKPAGESWERLLIDAEIAPWSPDKYGEIARQLGPPTAVKMEFAPDDIVALQAHVVSDQLRGSIPPHHLFAAIKDTVPPAPEKFDGLLQAFSTIRTIPGYLGAWPYPGLLDRLPLGIGRGTVVGPGTTRLLGGLYRYQGGDFSILSFDPDILQSAVQNLVADEADDLAQVRLHAGNLVGSQLESWANQQLFDRTALASLAGTDLLAILTRQLRVPRDQALTVAHEILGGQLQDPLGGDFQLVADPRSPVGHPRWVSTAWPDGQPPEVPPAGYLAPVLSWFRGGRANVTQYDDRLRAEAIIDVKRHRAADVR